MPVLSPELNNRLFGENSEFYQAFRVASVSANEGNMLLEQAKREKRILKDIQTIKEVQAICNLIQSLGNIESLLTGNSTVFEEEPQRLAEMGLPQDYFSLDDEKQLQALTSCLQKAANTLSDMATYTHVENLQPETVNLLQNSLRPIQKNIVLAAQSLNKVKGLQNSSDIIAEFDQWQSEHQNLRIQPVRFKPSQWDYFVAAYNDLLKNIKGFFNKLTSPAQTSALNQIPTSYNKKVAVEDTQPQGPNLPPETPPQQQPKRWPLKNAVQDTQPQGPNLPPETPSQQQPKKWPLKTAVQDTPPQGSSRQGPDRVPLPGLTSQKPSMTPGWQHLRNLTGNQFPQKTHKKTKDSRLRSKGNSPRRR